MKDLPCDLNSSNDCRKTFVEENDILKTSHGVKTTLCSKYSEGKGVPLRYEQHQRRLAQRYHSRPCLNVRLVWIGQNEEKAAPF